MDISKPSDECHACGTKPTLQQDVVIKLIRFLLTAPHVYESGVCSTFTYGAVKRVGIVLLNDATGLLMLSCDICQFNV